MKIDAHHHLWTLARGDYSWMSPALGPIYRDFAPADLAPHLARAGISKTVLVQAADTVAETEFMLSLADQTEWIAGVVGWVDMEGAEVVATLERLAQHPKFKGIRPMIQDIPDDDWILSPRVDTAFDAITAMGLSFDALVLPRHLPQLLRRLDRHPALACVIDHAAKPDLKAGDLERWASDIAAIAGHTAARCKLSGLLTEAKPDAPSAAFFEPFAHLRQAFGPDRLMFGSDWPVLNLAGDYETWVTLVEHLIADLSETDRAAIWSETAALFYRIEC